MNATAALQTTMDVWSQVEELVRVPQNDEELNSLVAALDSLLDIIGDNEGHHFMSLAGVLSSLIRDYEEDHLEAPEATGIDALVFLMEQHGLAQTDLPEIGSQGVVSETLSGKRQLNIRQITELAHRFKVSPATFLDAL